MQTSPRRWAALALAIPALALFLVAGFAAEKEQHAKIPKKAPSNRPTAIMGIHELMELFNEPLYDLAKKEVDKGKPSGDEGWETLRNRGLQAAEVANLVAIRPMGEEHRKQWSELTRDVQQAGLDLAHAAEAKDWDKSQDAWRMLIQNCNRCHTTLGSDHAPMLKP